MAQKALTVVFAILPPDTAGVSVRMAYDPDIPPQLLSYEVGQAVAKVVKKLKKPKKEESAA